MDRLHLIRTFIAVADARSFSAAASRLRVSRASVTKQVAALEATLKVRLFDRTTHAVNLTDAGAALLADGARLLDDFEALKLGIRSTRSAPSGTIRIGTPPSFGTFHLVPAIEAFRSTYPDIRIALSNDDGSLDIVKSGLDFSIRIAHALRDASMISRLLMHVPQVLVAAPSYLDRRGMPKAPRDLAQHNCLVHSVKAPTGIWQFRRGADAFRVRVSGSLSSNFGDAIRSAALVGAGISMHPMYMVDDDIRSGGLRVVMAEYIPTSLEIRAVYTRRDLPLRVSLFLEHLHGWLKGKTSWTAPPRRGERRA
ncbi:LysR family transcriptional regulator [Bradyrhizobium sp. NP1]|uniref:LysR family transcriptional regulator n=1 Tax=Bradyrhizobium sp. NP1 TaxID=3049772 RepID=UPI0025A50A89|nr:LysR family transcriptional regulator [Bradyrhizobium sp. NP1]WJR77284.1 LysR family transcriptional regulator [Bradyrhizobium sp. NP1]